MVRKTVTVGKHDEKTETAARAVQLAESFESTVRIISGDKMLNAKSIMGMLTLPFTPGDCLDVEVSGPDEDKAISAMEEYLS